MVKHFKLDSDSLTDTNRCNTIAIEVSDGGTIEVADRESVANDQPLKLEYFFWNLDCVRFEV